jgi:hypothetical protein
MTIGWNKWVSGADKSGAAQFAAIGQNRFGVFT